MTKGFGRLLLLWCLTHLFACNHYEPFSPSTETIGIVTDSTGFPSVTRNSKPYILAPQSRIFAGDIITTDEQSLVRIALDAGTHLQLGTRTRLLIDDCQHRSQRNQCRVMLTSGSIDVASAAGMPTGFVVGTTVAEVKSSAGSFWVGYEDKNRLVRVFSLSESDIRVSNEDGESVLLRPLDTTRILPGAAPAEVRSLTRQRVEQTMAGHQRIGR